VPTLQQTAVYQSEISGSDGSEHDDNLLGYIAV
jgi:hypothetical protein